MQKRAAVYFDSANACGLQANSAFCRKVKSFQYCFSSPKSEGRGEKVGHTVPGLQDTEE
jgi:hypothetical protein